LPRFLDSHPNEFFPQGTISVTRNTDESVGCVGSRQVLLVFTNPELLFAIPKRFRCNTEYAHNSKKFLCAVERNAVREEKMLGGVSNPMKYKKISFQVQEGKLDRMQQTHREGKFFLWQQRNRTELCTPEKLDLWRQREIEYNWAVVTGRVDPQLPGKRNKPLAKYDWKKKFTVRDN
jgi:hypothetical protein